jgi:hypothetical protein
MAGRGPEIGERSPSGARSPISGYSLSFREVQILSIASLYDSPYLAENQA